MTTDDPARRPGHYSAGIIGLSGIAVNRDPRATHPALGQKHGWTHAAAYDLVPSTEVVAICDLQPALIAKMAASLQELTSGRFVLGYGVGTGRETEYTQFGYTMPRPRVRVEMLEEALQVIKLLWTESPANFSGKYYWVADNRAAPKPNPVPPSWLAAPASAARCGSLPATPTGGTSV